MNRIGGTLLVWPALAAAIFFTVGYWLMLNGHPFEDAYILFIYVENIAAGHGIVYYPGGPPAEGATDFLWLMALSVLRLLGTDVAVAALTLNAAGAALLSWLMMHAARHVADRTALHALGAVSAALLPASPLAAASYGGFSTMLFAALIAILFYGQWRWPPARLAWLPAFALVLALFRPDGALIGVLATAIALLQLRGAPHLRRFLLIAAASGAIGALYFFWRYAYFDMLLPLPLSVKSSTDGMLPGARAAVAWFARVLWYLPLIAAALLLIEKPGRLLAALAPPAALLVALLFVSSNQNIALRYQNATFGVVLVVFAVAILQVADRLTSAGRYRRAGLIVILLFGFAATSDAGFRYLRREVDHMTQRDYSNNLAFHIGEIQSSDLVIALTEAGKFAYWSRGEKYDLVGLNTAEVVRGALGDDFLAAVSPDIIYTHSADVFTGLVGCDAGYRTRSAAALEAERKPEFRDWRAWENPVLRAVGAVADHLAANPKAYRIYQGCYAGRFDHLFAVRVDGRVPPEMFEDALRLSLSPDGRRSYFDMKRARRSGG
jgi:hypothetical protein